MAEDRVIEDNGGRDNMTHDNEDSPKSNNGRWRLRRLTTSGVEAGAFGERQGTAETEGQVSEDFDRLKDDA